MAQRSAAVREVCLTKGAKIAYMRFMMSYALEFETEVEEEVESIGIVVLRIARELVCLAFAFGVNTAILSVVEV